MMQLILKFFYKIYYNLQYDLISSSLKRKKAKNPKIIHVLCRGESLKYYKNFYVLNKPDLIILANFEKDDISKSGILNKIKDIPVSLVANISEPIPHLKDLQQINIDEVFISRITTKSKNMIRSNYRLNSIHKNIKYINKKFLHSYLMINKKTKGVWNTGLFACTKNPKEIFIFGMDFFDTDYYYGKVDYMLSSIEKKERSNKYKNNFKKTFEYIIRIYNKINFKNISISKSYLKLKNLKNIYN